MLKQIILDTETTGLDPKSGHRVIEIGCIEISIENLQVNNFMSI
jgi:DNA polymerase-3 subunit epsilon